MKRQKSKKRWKINRYVIVRNEQVEGSIPSISSIEKPPIFKDWRFFLCLFFLYLCAVFCRVLPHRCGKMCGKIHTEFIIFLAISMVFSSA